MFFPRKLKLIFFLILILNSQQTLPASGIYRSVDEHGRVTYSDALTDGAQEIIITDDRFSRRLHHVMRVYDGDTIILEGGKHIRLLGINTPEIESRQRTGEPGGVAAKKWLQAQLQENKVYLEYDQEKQDKYKRSLAHLFLPDGKHLNLAMLENGLATASIIPPNLRYAEKIIHAQQHAEKLQLGIWSMPEYQVRPISEITNHTKGWQRFSGTPVTIRKSKKFTRLIITDNIDIRIANSNLDLFPELSIYIGKSLEIRGWVSRKNDHYTILIQHPSALIAR